MDRGEEKVWYFAYGSNLCVEQMSRRTGPIGEDEKARVSPGCPAIGWSSTCGATTDKCTPTSRSREKE